MGRLITLDRYLNALSEKTLDNTRQLRRDTHQRRNGMEDLYGVCFSANGDANNPATFYISLSPDYVYLERFAFKFVIKPFVSSVAGASSGTLTINNTMLEAKAVQDPQTSDINVSITPNPHTHTVSGSIGGIDYGVTKRGTSSTDWRVVIDGIDITPYLIAQHDGEWINGEGIYPTNRLDRRIDFYDILEVCDVLTDEGRESDREKILASTFKPIQIYSDAPFGVDAYLYMKLSHVNR